MMNRRQRAAQRQADALAAELDSILADDPPAAPPDVAAVVAAELDRRAQAEAEAEAAADFERHRHPTGSGCIFCGLGCLRVATVDGGYTPGWHGNPDGGWHCEACERDLFQMVGDTRADRKMRVMLALLGLEHNIPLPALGNPQAFEHIPVWWSEHPGAAPVFDLDERFAHVDRDALRAAWDAVNGTRVEARLPRLRPAAARPDGTPDGPARRRRPTHPGGAPGRPARPAAIGWLFSAARQRSADERAPGGIFFLPRRWRSAARATEPLGGLETREKQCT